MNTISPRRTLPAIAMVSVATLVFLTTGIGSASAVAGESSNASSRYLSGALFTNVLPAVIDLSGSTATNNGTAANDVEQNNLNLTALSALNVTAPGGLQIPLHIANAGVLGQYAAANNDGSSLAATGLVGSGGTIGVANVDPGTVPGPLTFDLSNAVGNSGLGAALTNEVANLSLDVGALSSRAALDGPPSQRSYEIASLGLNFKSAAVGSLVSRLGTQIAALQGTADGLSANLKVALGGPLATVNVSTTNLASVVAADLTGTRSANGVTIDLATGNITVDLSKFMTLNGLSPNTDILTTTQITAIANAVTALVTSVVTKVGNDLQTALNAITVTAAINAPITGTQLVGINTSVGAILAGSTAGITILGGTFTLTGVLGLLSPVVAGLGGVTASLVTAVATPVNALVSPAVNQVIATVLRLTANAQSTAAGADSVTALRVGLLPGLTRATTADLATSTVGPNVQIPNPTITGIAPTHGTESGGTSVTLTGTGLNTVTSVTIGGNTVTPTSQTATSLTFVTPAHTAGAVTVTANAPQGNSGTLSYTYDAVASATSSLAPTSGPDSGGTNVTITGTGFIGATGVTFDGVAGTGFTVLSPTQILVTTPAHPVGAVGVIVVDPAGNSTPRTYTYLASPTTATSLSPATGPEEGGQTVTITGTNLTDATGATFDGVAGTAFTHVDATHATVVTPAHVPATVPVIVTNPAGDGTGLTYQYVASASAATSLTPTTGPETGGTTVTITGSGFTGATGVTFGGIAATGVTVVSPTTITAVAPAHVAGAVGVVVQDPAGNSAPLTYTYTAVASATTGLAPASGPDTGGTDVTITGTGFLGATGVTFGGVPGTNFTVLSSTQILVTSPAHLAGAVGVVVLDPAGNSAPRTFTYTTTPSTETSLTPTTGPEEGGQTVTITGTNMNDATGVTFDGVPGTNFTVVDATHATVRTPAHSPATVPVVLVNPAGNGTGLTYTFTGSPSAATLLVPNTGLETGGTAVTILGSGFTGATGVTFGGVPATAVVVVDDNTITAVSPAHVAGAVGVVVQDPAGDSAPQTFTYVAVPSVAAALLPITGPDTGGTSVTITGTGFLGATGVTFGGTPGTGFVVNSPTSITVTAPAHLAGAVSVVVQDPAGNSVGLPFLYTPTASTETSLTPSSGPQEGDTLVTITGTNTNDASGVTFGGVPGNSFTVVDATHATVRTPAHAVGTVPVVLVNAAGNGTGLSYTFVGSPSVAGSVTPNFGPETGGTAVTILGSGFTGATGVTFDGVPATAVVVVDGNTITAVAPPHAAGTVDVVVQDLAGDSAPLPYTYTAIGSTALSLTPVSGPDAGGTNVTITGVGFLAATGVSFGGNAGTNFQVTSPTTITVTAPAGVAGPTLVVVQDPAGNSLPLAYTYLPGGSAETSLTPTTGPEEGGTLVTITGTNVNDAIGATFGGLPGSSFTIVSNTEATVVTPPHAPGSVPVVLVNLAGNGTGLSYTYTATPSDAASITPNTGPERGGTPVVILGTGFTGATGVTFDGVAATAVVVVDSGTITAVAPAHAAGAVDVVVNDPAGDSAPLTYTYTGVPSVAAALLPVAGPDTGGTAVTITGTGFLGATGVTFGGTAATDFTVNSPTSITVTSPAHLAGAVTVVVQDPAGNSIGLPFLYTPTASTETSLTPSSGPQEGDTLVTITGTNMNDATGVTFGGVPGNSFTVVDATHATVRTPAHAVGTVPVVLVNAAGNGTGLNYTFTASPSVAGSITPNTGPETGGTPVVILGAGFTGATGVTFDGVAATAVVVVDGNTITAVAPPHAAGAVDVVVQDPAGDSDPLTYTYTGVASVAASLLPISGTDAGGTTVTITGVGFLGATGVTFDGTAGTSFTVVSPTRITVVTPAHPAGLVDVVVQDPAGDSAALPYTFLPVASTESALTPTHGTQAGGTTVTITGTGLADATGVRFGTALGTDYTVVDATHATVVTPQHAVGTVAVTVVNPAGNGTGLSYTFDPEAADATSLAPTTGPETGGTTVTITGTGFLGATGVTFDGTAGTGFTVVNDTTITVTTPVHAAGDVDVVVTDPTGDSDPLTFTYAATASDASGLSPTSGTVAGGTLVTITGTGFLGATGVTFDGTSGTDVTVVNSTTITVRTPEHDATGAVDVVVQDPAGDSDPLTYTYVAVAAHLVSLSPMTGPQAGGTTVTITGTGLLGSTGATFGLAAGTDYTVVNDTTATVVTPAHAVGLVAVTVTDPAGNGTGLGFTFVNVAATVDSLDPTSGTQDGGTLVTITGSGFLGATGVRFGASNGTSFTVVDDTTITVRTPAHAPGDVNVVVLDPAGNSAPATYTYLGVASAATGIAPGSGPANGGTAVTITGTGFTGATGVTFDGVPATDFTVVNDTTITATTPAGTTGTAPVVVQDPAGDSDPIDFIYTAGASITDVSPNLVPEAGGIPITITGTCFTGATAVMFGDITVTDFTVNPAGTTITVIAPAGEGIVDVTVVGSATCGTAVLPAAVSYQAAASVALLLSPARGPETGHTLVTITGHGFTGSTGVTFDGRPGTSFTIVDDQTITVRTPVHDPGDVDVIVLDPDADSPTLLFTYTPVSNGSGAAPGNGNGGTSTAGSPLAFTGVNGTDAAAAALVLLGIGIVLVLIWWWRRRHDSHNADDSVQ